MGKNSSQPIARGVAANAPSHTEFHLLQSKKTKKFFRKRKEGTDGIDTVDEYQEQPIHERLRDGFLSDDD